MTEKEYLQVFQNPVFKNEPFTECQAYLYLVFSVAPKDNTFWKNGKLVTAKKGEIITSYRELADKWLWNKSRVNHFLKRLEMLEVIKMECNSQWTKIVIDQEKFNAFLDN